MTKRDYIDKFEKVTNIIDELRELNHTYKDLEALYYENKLNEEQKKDYKDIGKKIEQKSYVLMERMIK